MEADERRDAPVVHVVDLDALYGGDHPAVLAVQRGARVQVVQRVPAHPEALTANHLLAF